MLKKLRLPHVTRMRNKEENIIAYRISVVINYTMSSEESEKANYAIVYKHNASSTSLTVSRTPKARTDKQAIRNKHQIASKLIT